MFFHRPVSLRKPHNQQGNTSVLHLLQTLQQLSSCCAGLQQLREVRHDA